MKLLLLGVQSEASRENDPKEQTLFYLNLDFVDQSPEYVSEIEKDESTSYKPPETIFKKNRDEEAANTDSAGKKKKVEGVMDHRT